MSIEALKAVAMIMGGCMTNNVALELIVKYPFLLCYFMISYYLCDFLLPFSSQFFPPFSSFSLLVSPTLAPSFLAFSFSLDFFFVCFSVYLGIYRIFSSFIFFSLPFPHWRGIPIPHFVDFTFISSFRAFSSSFLFLVMCSLVSGFTCLLFLM